MVTTATYLASDGSRGRDLFIAFQNQKPLRADELGELFTTLARDYRDLTGGRTLVVGRLETGSLYAILQDAIGQAGPFISNAVEVAKAIKGIADFAKTLKDLLGEEQGARPKSPARRRRKKRVGVRSITAILKVAADSGSSIELSHTTRDGEKFEVRMTPPEAARAHAALEAERALLRIERSQDAERMRFLAGNPEPRQIADSLATLGRTDNTRIFIRMIVGALRNAGVAHVINEVAEELDRRGLPDIAAAVRAEILALP